jgi:hypothetical protein
MDNETHIIKLTAQVEQLKANEETKISKQQESAMLADFAREKDVLED